MTTARALILAVAVGAAATGVAFGADDDAPLLPAEAAASLGSTDPAAIGADAASRGDDISIVTFDDAFVSRGASVKTEIPEAADSALRLRTASGRLQLIPQGVSAEATDGQVVSGGEAVIYANTSADADTAVKPIERGLETFTNIRSADAPQRYSWSVDLSGDEQLQKTDDGQVVVLDPTPPISRDRLPAPVDADSSQGAGIAAAEEGITPAAASQPSQGSAQDGVSDAGTARPAGVSVTSLDPRTLTASARAHAATVDRDQPVLGELSAQALAARSTEVDDLAGALASNELRDAQRSGDEHLQQTNEDNAELSQSQPVVVATISAPASVDANGESVPTSLGIAGDELVLSVEHRSEDVAYPIAADPIITIPVIAYRLAYYPVYRNETYVSGWADSASYIGSWHPSYCGSLVACASLGGGWFAATQGANRYLAYWTSWNWGPAYQLYTYPLYATRTVLDHWEPYWEPYVALVDVWSDPDQAVAWNTGFDVYEEPGDYDPTDGPDIQLIAGAFDGYSGAGKMRGCTVVTGHGKIDVPGMFDVAHPQFRTRFCWSKYKKKASYAAGSMSFDPGVARGYELCCGVDITVRDAHVDYYGWNGGDQGVARMARDFDLTVSPTGGLKIGKYTYQRYVYAIRGYWNGAYEGVLRVR